MYTFLCDENMCNTLRKHFSCLSGPEAALLNLDILYNHYLLIVSSVDSMFHIQ
jgi:hypothetical protein